MSQPQFVVKYKGETKVFNSASLMAIWAWGRSVSDMEVYPIGERITRMPSCGSEFQIKADRVRTRMIVNDQES